MTHAMPANAASLRNHAFGVVFMLVGSTVVLGSVVVMNELSQPPERQEVETGTIIEVQQPPPPKPKPKLERPKPKPKPRPKSPPPPSMAALTSGLSGIEVDLPNLQFQDLGGAASDLFGGGEDVVHTSDSVDEAPRAVQQTAVQYPPRLRDKGVEGYVLFSVLVDATGNVTRVKILESKPPGVFDDAAREAIQGWKFQPAYYEGEPVKSWAQQKISFELRR